MSELADYVRAKIPALAGQSDADLEAYVRDRHPDLAAHVSGTNNDSSVASRAKAHLAANATRTPSGTYEPSPTGADNPPETTGADVIDQRIPLGGMTQTLKGVAVGAGKGVISTPYHVGMATMRGGYKLAKFFGYNDPELETALNGPETRDVESALQAHGSEHIGKFIENAGEFAMGDAAIKGVTEAVPVLAKAAAAAPKLARIVKGAIVGGGVTAAEGGDAETGAILGGAIPAIGIAAEAAAPLAKALKASAQKSMAQFLAPTKATMKNLAEKVAPGLIEKGTIFFTRRGFTEAAAAEADNFGQQIENLWTNLPAGTKVKTANITAAIDDAINELNPTGPMKTTMTPVQGAPGVMVPVKQAHAIPLEPAAIRNLRRVKSLIENATDDSGDADAELLREMRQVWDATVAQKGGYAGKTLSLADSAGLNARKAAATAIRNELAQQFPNIAAVNKQFNFWANARDVMRETLARKAGQSQPMGQQLMRVAGAAAGAKGGAVKAILTGEAAGLFRKLTTSPAWSTTSAVLKDRLANMLASGGKGPAVALMKNMMRAATSNATQPRGN